MKATTPSKMALLGRSGWCHSVWFSSFEDAPFALLDSLLVQRQPTTALAKVWTRLRALREISTRPLDTSRRHALVFHGVVYLQGLVSDVRRHKTDPKAAVSA